jgi:pyridoxine 5-phosphate synthase
MIALSVNLNKIALLRNSRSGNSPDILAYAQLAIDAGARGITVHPRPDQRHIRAMDISPLKNFLQAYPHIEFNIEGNPFAAPQGSYPGFMQLVDISRPHQCTLVPDADAQLTSDHGFDLTRDGEMLKPIIKKLKSWQVRVSLFIDPDIEQISRAAELDIDRIELYTGPFAEAYARDSRSKHTRELFQQHCDAAQHAHALGLGVNAGHDLNLKNLQLYRQLPHLQEVSIGHALTVDAITMGFANAIAAYQVRLNA